MTTLALDTGNIPLGQHNAPAWERYEAAMRGIFDRRYYTNQGPLTRQFEERLQAFLGVRHAVCVTNATIGLMMASEALGLSGKVLVHANGPAGIAVDHAFAWCGVQPVFCETHEQLAASLDTTASAVLGANVWGGTCNPAALEAFGAAHGLPVLFDSAQGFGCRAKGATAGVHGALEVFSFDEAHILNAAGGACVATDDDELAARLRNIRSSYGAGRPVEVVKTSNGRMSEAQAAMGLLSLDDFEANRARNATQFAIYRERLDAIEGVRVLEPACVEVSNYETLICEVDEHAAGTTRERLVEKLAAAQVSARVVTGGVQLPLGAKLGEADIARIAGVIGRVIGDKAEKSGAAQ